VAICEKTNFVPKGWGYEHWLVNNDKYCGKLLFFKCGKRCSWHYHKIKEEHFYVHKGSILVLYRDPTEYDCDLIVRANMIQLEEGDVFHIPVGRRHQIQALRDTELFEFSTHHEDSDSYRIEKGN